MKQKKGVTDVSPLMHELATYISKSPGKKLPKQVQEHTKYHILDTLAAMVSGSKLLPGLQAISYVKTLGGTKEAAVVGSRVLTNAVNAALANGMLAHADETDDSHSPSLTHPGCGIVSAALAMAERERRDGTAWLRAVALGYDVSARMSLALGSVAFSRVGHMTHCFGPTFGAAAASAALACLNSSQVRYVLSYAAQQASGLSSYARDQDHIEKAFDFGGMAARNGVTAATMVAAGCTAVDDIFTGDRNFFSVYDESKRIDRPPMPEILVRDLGKTYEIVNTNIKRWSVGSPIQAPLDSLYELIRRENITAESIDKVVVRVYAAGAKVTNNREMPNICMQHMCALMLTDGIVTYDSTHDDQRMKDSKVLAMRKRIELIGDDELEKLRPEKHGIIDILLKDGRHLYHHTRAVRGTVQNPMTRAEVDEKCYHLMAPVLGRKKARALCDGIWNVEEIEDVRELRSLLQV